MVTTTYTGTLRRIDGQIVGSIVDNFGWEITLHATPDPAGGYTLTGTLGEPPPDFWLDVIDGERVE